MKPNRILPALLLASTLLAFTPASAQGEETLLDTFDQYTPVFYPPIPEEDWVFADYTTTGATANEIDLTTSPAVSGNAIRIGGHSGFTATPQAPDIGFSGPLQCDGDVHEKIEFDFQITTGQVDQTDIRYQIRLIGADASHFMIEVFDNDASLGIQATISSTTGAEASLSLGSITADEFWHFEILGLDCAEEEMRASMYKTADGTSASAVFVNGASLAGTFSAPTKFQVVMETVSAADVLPESYLDNLELTTDAPAAPGVIFCAEPLLGASADWGYDYKENATFDEEITGIGTDLQDGFILDGDSGNSAYLGKAFTPGTTGLRQVARVESGSEGGTSVVRLAYTTGAVTLSDGSTGDTGVDLTTSGNGQETGNFEDNIQAVLIENGDQWSVSIRYSLGGSSLAVIDGSANYGANPNTPHTFSFVVNTGSSTITGPIVDSENHTLFDSGFSIAPGKAQLYGEEGRIIERTIPSGLATSEWKDSWIIAKGDTVLEALTYIDDNTDAEQADDSTCIFDLIGTAVRVGQAGSTPGSFISQPPPDTGGSGGLFDPANIDSGLFIGFLLVAGMIFTGARQGIVGMGLVGVFLLGLGLGFALGWIPLWLVLVMFVVSLAAVWFLPKPSGDGVS